MTSHADSKAHRLTQNRSISAAFRSGETSGFHNSFDLSRLRLEKASVQL